MKGLVEELAAVEHERWAHWQRYVHQQCRRLDDGSLVIPAHLVSRWEKQIDTPYDHLSEREKQSDRDQVVKALPVLARYFPSVRTEIGAAYDEGFK